MPIPFTADVSAVASSTVPWAADPSSIPSDMASLVAVVAATTTSTIAAAATSIAVVEHGNGSGGGGGPSGGPGGGEGECRLLGPFALLVQLALGGLALLSLVYKRWRERPQRPVKIWFFDVSKQVFGSVLVHMANIFMSMLTSGRFSMELAAPTVARMLRRQDIPYVPNPCSFYLLNLAIDTTIGIPILILLLRVLTGLVSYTPLGKPHESIQSGNYGSPPNAWWWLKQSIIYFCGLFGMKICVLLIFLILPWISRVGDWALGWTEGNERLQIFFVMMLFPLIMNAVQYYIIDSFIKKKDMGHERISQEDDDRDPFDDSFGDDSDDDGSMSDESNESVKMARSASFTNTQKKSAKNAREEYDPDLDGQTVVGSSRSQEERDKLLPRELLPHE